MICLGLIDRVPRGVMKLNMLTMYQFVSRGQTRSPKRPKQITNVPADYPDTASPSSSPRV